MNRHCDDYINDPETPECLREYLRVERMPAVEKYRQPLRPKCFATHEGKRVRIVMASRFGDVGITEDLTAERGYDLRVYLNALSDFADEP